MEKEGRSAEPAATAQPLAYPLAFGHWSLRRDKLVCRLPRRILRVTAPAALLGQVLALCNGQRRWEQVAQQLGARWEGGAVSAFLDRLSAEGALVEAGEALARWSDIGQVPGVYPRGAGAEELPRLTDGARRRLRPGRGGSMPQDGSAQVLRELLCARESLRTFDDAPLSAAALRAIAWAAHGVTRPAADAAIGWHRTVASGGNMHSARWFVYVLRALPDDAAGVELEPGLSEAFFHQEGGVTFERVHPRWQDAWRILLDPRVLQFASAMLLPACDVGVPARKYGNRAALFAHIEAGQSLQNAQLMAAALGAGAIVRGDTAAEPVLSSLAPALRGVGVGGARWLVMPSLVVGAAPGEQQVRAQRVDGDMVVSTGTAWPAAAPRFAFLASRVDRASALGLGRSRDPIIAMRKAQAEAWERLGWVTVGRTVHGTLAQTPGALDPRAFHAYTDRQYAAPGFPLRPFSTQRRYLWRGGFEVGTGRAVALPVECLHALSALPPWARRQPCTSATTSGMAAWTDAEGALCRATLELIERDAFARAWLAGRPAPLLVLDSLPADARERVRGLQGGGHRVALAAIGAGWVPVYSVFVQSLQRPFTAITAAAAFDAEEALHKALDEAEGRAAHAAAFPARPVAAAAEVVSTTDVNRYYQSRRFFRRSDFYAEGLPSSSFGTEGSGYCVDWPALKARMAAAGHLLYAFDLTPEGAAVDQGRTPLHVVRAMVTGLVPLWLQYGMQPAGLPAFRDAAAEAPRRGPSSFIHPFT